MPPALRPALSSLLLCLPIAASATDDWVATSDAHARIVLDSFAKYSPEGAGGIGVDGLDEAIIDLGPRLYERQMADSVAVLTELRGRLTEAAHPKVRQDLGILIQSVEEGIESARLNRDLMLPYTNVPQLVFGGIRALLDPQVAEERYPAAVVRLRRYAGLEDGYEPVTQLAMARTRERFDVAGLSGPYRAEIEQDLGRAATFIDGIEQLLSNTGLEGWREPYDVLADQLRAYGDWVRSEILPRARDDFRLPPALYADALRNWGVDESPEKLIEIATHGYMDIRNEMAVIGRLVAEQKGYETDDFREVIRLLKRDGAIDGDVLLDHYESVLGQIEEIIEEQQLISLPQRPAGIRIATAAETATQPAPHLDPPRLLGNTGEYPYFVIPLIEQNDDGSWPQSDDTYEAGAWTLTAHEARPGHEMQFSSMIESDVSITRALFAFNSANIEGWGLYAEAITKPYLPLDGQLISLQYRLMRAARMFLDPMLNLGMITPDDAKRLIVEDIGVSESWAKHEIERYTYRLPGQATAYYYGYAKLQALRAQAEVALGNTFDQRAFHDFVVAQGLLPPDILKDAVMNEFVPAERRQGLARVRR